MSILSSAIKSGVGYGRRILKVTPEFLLGDTSEIIGRAMKNQKGSIWQKGKAGFKALENYNNAQKGSFARRVLKTLGETPGAVAKGYKTAYAAAKSAGKSGVWAGVKGAGKAVAKRMPLIGAALTVAIETPNIYGAFKDGGFKEGMKEVGGAGVELGCMAAGAAIGSCFGPVGTIVGGLVGGIAGMFVRGKSHSEKKAEQEAQQAQAEVVQYTPEDIELLRACGFSDEDILALQQAGYPMEQLEKAIMEQLEQDQLNLPQVEPTPHYEGVDNSQYYYNQQPSQTQDNDQQYQYDPTKAYQYNNLYPQNLMGFNNPFSLYGNNGYTPSSYSNDIMYQYYFGNMGLSNPYSQINYPQFQYYG
ncbi:hypothetical protein IJ472_04970 [bacterium]|nr:hypothetical protein [bacterium]